MRNLPRFMRTHDEPKPKTNGRYAVVNLNQMPLKFTFWHKCYSDASKEAERLARLNPGVPFSVLSEFSTVTAPLAPVKWESHGDYFSYDYYSEDVSDDNVPF